MFNQDSIDIRVGPFSVRVDYVTAQVVGTLFVKGKAYLEITGGSWARVVESLIEALQVRYRFVNSQMAKVETALELYADASMKMKKLDVMLNRQGLIHPLDPIHLSDEDQEMLEIPDHLEKLIQKLEIAK